MGREEIRTKRALEKNPIEACNEVQRRFYPELFYRFGRIADPRHQSYITYAGKTMLGQIYYKGIAGIISMQDMTDKFSNPQVWKIWLPLWEWNWRDILYQRKTSWDSNK